MATGTGSRVMRIGELAELVGITPRTIRYYEEIGLLGPESERPEGKHRVYTEADALRLTEIVRLKELLGLSLEQLLALVDAETARADLRRELHETSDPVRRRELRQQALGHIDTQLELARTRIAELQKLEQSLAERRELVLAHLHQLP
jgi:MerR family transcriptional regulator, repressor of the yfmOP operon